MTQERPIAMVLAGGASSRLGGGDKALLELGSATMLDRVLDRLRPQAGRIAISANGDPARFEHFALPVFADGHDGLWGPLAGIRAAMAWAGEAGAAHVATVPADAPFLPHDLIKRLSAEASPDRIAVAASPGGIHPVFALWPVGLEADLSRFLDGGGRKVMEFVRAHPHVLVEFEGGTLDPFFNVNTPQDLAEAKVWMDKGA